MKVPVTWLREYVEVDATTPQIADRLAIATGEVERISYRGVADQDGNHGHYLVGRVVEAGKHPNADRLQLCRVDVGEEEPRQIVCGAWNFGAGATVAVALPGAVLPDGRTLERAKLRGSVSDGMILSEAELELSSEHAGILVLPEPWEPGTPLRDVLPLGEEVLEIEMTRNRPDCLSVYGIAREVAALFAGELRPMPEAEPELAGSEHPDITIEDYEGCPRYIGRLFRDVTLAPSPPWLKARLTAAGMRPISNVVDITNYVMLALGNPLHAFDFETLRGGRIIVRRARAGEEFTSLDGNLRKLDPADLVIADAEGAIAFAGIMGGLDTEVTESTTSVLLEAANFEPGTILWSSERHALRTEGSNRWEKGVDPYLAPPAARLATQLMVDLAGARWTGATDELGELPEPPVVHFRTGRANRIIGVDIDEQEQKDVLERLGFDVVAGWDVHVPTWRMRDTTREIDLVEEVARVHGLERIPFTLPLRSAMFGSLSQAQRLRRLVEDVLAGAGFSEAYTLSLVARDPDPDALRLPVPLTSEHGVLRTTLLEGLAAAARHNVAVGNDGIALFEVARVYLPSGGELPEERWRRRRHRRGRLPAGQGRRRGALRGARHRARARADAASLPASRQGGDARGGLGGRAPSGAPRRRVGRLRARPGHALRAGAGARRVRGRGQLSGRPPGSRLRRRRGRAGRRADRGGPRGRRARAARRGRLRRLPWRADPGRKEVGGAARQLPVARAHAFRRGRSCHQGARRCSSRREVRCRAPRLAPSG